MVVMVVVLLVVVLPVMVTMVVTIQMIVMSDDYNGYCDKVTDDGDFFLPNVFPIVINIFQDHSAVVFVTHAFIMIDRLKSSGELKDMVKSFCCFGNTLYSPR